MLNKEKYADELMDFIINDKSLAYDIRTKTIADCAETPCKFCGFFCKGDCMEKRKDWLNSEYVEPTDWNKVPVDTPILVRDHEDYPWEKRYFANYENGMVCAWEDGKTSWSADGKNSVYRWQYAKLAKDIKQPRDDAWHNLKYQKPQDGQEVLTWDGLGVREDRWSDDEDYFENTDAEEIWWMELPEPPKKGVSHE